MILRAGSSLGRIVAAFAAALMTLLVVQAPIAAIDRLMHETGHTHVANPLAGPLLSSGDHDHDHHHDATGGHDDGDAPDSQPERAEQAAPSPEGQAADASAPGPHHHHADASSTSTYGLAETFDPPGARLAAIAAFRLDDNLKNGIGGLQQDRPPKRILVHVA